MAECRRLICTVPNPPRQQAFLCAAIYAEKRAENFMRTSFDLASLDTRRYSTAECWENWRTWHVLKYI